MRITEAAVAPWKFVRDYFGGGLMSKLRRSSVQPTDAQKRSAVHHVVHEYANFVSSGEMVRSGKHLGKSLDPPIGTHVAHAFLLNCRKMCDFFCGPGQSDDVVANHYVDKTFELPFCGSLQERERLNKQLAHITYARVDKAREIRNDDQLQMYVELQAAWEDFCKHLPEPYKTYFEKEIEAKKLSRGFGDLDLRCGEKIKH